MLKSNMDRAAGFTIIELLIVIIIIGILTSIAIIAPAGLLVISRDNQRADDVASIDRKLEQDYNEQLTGQPSYPSMTTFTNDITSVVNKTNVVGDNNTAAGVDSAIYQSPGGPANSVQAATSTSVSSPVSSGSPALNVYYYQALQSDGSPCKIATQTCVSFRLFYLKESTKTLNTPLVSTHQQ